ncbi:MAG: helix-turn-helix transcriptional regulator [Eubacteriales bacterium]|nr:helix-turn-helix transcriptional regulator [Eubacteriales bacterium]
MQSKPVAKYIFRVFLSYLFAIGIPILVLAGYFLWETVPRMKRELYDGYGEAVTNDIRRMDETLESMTDFAFSVSAFPYLRDLQTTSYKNAIFSYSQMLQFLRVFRQSNECFSNIGMYVRRSDLLLNTDGVTVVAKEDSALNEPLTAFTKAKQFKQCYSDAEGGLAVFSTLPKYLFNADIILIFHLDMQALYEGLQMDNLCLYQEDGQRLFGIEGLERLPKERLSMSAAAPLEITQGKATLFYRYDSLSGLYFARAYQSDTLADIITANVRLSVIVLFTSLAVACTVAFLLTRHHTKPITQLSESLKSIEPLRPSSGGSMLESISAKLNTLKESNAQYRESLSQSEEIIKDRAIQDMLWGHIPGSGALTPFLRQAGIQVIPDAYYAALITTDVNAAIKQPNKLCEINVLVKNMIEQHLGGSIAVVGGVQLDINRIVFVLCSEGDTLSQREISIWQRVVSDVEASLTTSFLVKLRVAIGYPVRSTEDLCESFMNLRKMLNRLQLDEKIVFQSHGDNSAALYPDYFQVNLASGIQSGDPQKVLQVLEQMFRLEERGLSGSDALSFQYLTIGNVMIRLMNAMGSVSRDGLDVLRIFNEETDPEKRRTRLTEHLLMLTEAFKSQNMQEEASVYISSAKDYIRQNLHRDLSLGEIADYIGIHTSYFSRIFKQEVGLTPLQYITVLKVEKAKVDLRQGDLSVKQVAADLGYNDTRGFIRSFKKIEGCTPGEFKAGCVKEG